MTKFLALDAESLEFLEAEIAAYQPTLVIIDPLATYMGSEIDMHRYNEVTQFMSQIDAIARTYKACIIGVRHLTKASHDQAAKRGIGSVGFMGRARSAFLVGNDPQDKQGKALAHSKANYAEKGKTLIYSLIGDKNETAKIKWLRKADFSADDLMAPSLPGRPSVQDHAQMRLGEKND